MAVNVAACRGFFAGLPIEKKINRSLPSSAPEAQSSTRILPGFPPILPVFFFGEASTDTEAIDCHLPTPKQSIVTQPSVLTLARTAVYC
jgi:hypothetical protein